MEKAWWNTNRLIFLSTYFNFSTYLLIKYSSAPNDIIVLIAYKASSIIALADDYYLFFIPLVFRVNL